MKTSKARPTSQPARSTRPSSPRNAAANTSATPSRSSRTSPMRSSGACGCPPRARTPRTSSSPKSAAPWATSSPSRSSNPPARSARTSAANNVFFLHVSLVPYIGPSQELKTKPTQHSVAALRSIGIQPEAIVIRSDREVPAAHAREDRPHVRCRHRRRASAARTRRASTTSPRPCTPRAWTRTSSAPWTCRSRTWTGPAGTSCSTPSTTPSTRLRSHSWASTSTCRTPTCP